MLFQAKETILGTGGFVMMLISPIVAEFNSVIAGLVAICGLTLSIIKIRHAILLYRNDKLHFSKKNKSISK